MIKKMNKLLATSARIIINAGIKMMQSAFGVPAKSKMMASDVLVWIKKIVPIETASFDLYAYLAPTQVWKDWIEFDWTREKKYLEDVYDCKVPEDLAYAYGLFMTDGTCGLSKFGNSSGAFWNIVNSDLGFLERAKEALNWEYKGKLEFVIKQYDYYKKGKKTNLGERKKDLYCLEAKVKRIGTRQAHRGYKKSNQGMRVDMIREWKYLFYEELNGLKRIPKPIWDKYPKVIRAFLEGVADGDGSKRSPFYISMNHRNKNTAVSISILMNCIGWKNRVVYFPEKEIRIYFDKRTEKFESLACDNFAHAFGTHASEILDITVFRVYGLVHNKNTGVKIGYHYWNAAVSQDPDGKHLYFIEPQNGIMTEVLGQKEIIMGEWKYTPVKIYLY